MTKKEEKEELFIPKTKHKALKIILATLLIIGMGIGGYFLYQEKFNNPKKTVVNIIEDIQKNTKNSLNLIQNTDKYKINGLVKVNATLPGELKKISEIIEKFDLQFNGEIDNENSINNITLNTKYKNGKLLDIKLYNEKKDLYVLLEGLYDKYLHLSLDSELEGITSGEFDISKKDIEVLFNSTLEALKKTFNELEFKNTSDTIIIDEKEQKVSNNYIELKGNDLKNFLKQIITNLSNDNDFKKTLKNLTHEDSQNTLDAIIKILDEQEIKEIVKINFYTNGLLTQKLVSIRTEIITEDGKTSLYIDKIADDEEMITFKTLGVNIIGKLKKNNTIANAYLNAEVMGMAFKIEINSNYEKINEVTKADISNSQDIDKLTEEDANAINDKLQNNETIANLLKDIAETNLIQE